MDWKIELVAIPVTDVDRAKAFYVEQAGFHADHDYQVSDVLRFVQLTPPGSACSIVLGTGSPRCRPARRKVCNASSPMSRPPAGNSLRMACKPQATKRLCSQTTPACADQV